MIDKLIDTNVFSEIFKRNILVKKYVENSGGRRWFDNLCRMFAMAKSPTEKQRIKKSLANFPILHFTPAISLRTIALIDAYSYSFGLQLPDAQIAAACLENDYHLWARDFQFIAGLKIIVPPFPIILSVNAD